MLEDYTVTVRLPINDTATNGTAPFTFGSSFGYNRETEGETEFVWYWDGEDIWLPPGNTTIYAMFKGMLHCVPSGQPIHPPPSVGADVGADDTPSEFPAVGDTLILKLWSPDFLRLAELLPPGAPAVREIVYQNIDRDDAIRRAADLITTSPNTYRSFFTTDADNGEVSDEVFRNRVTAWVRDVWSNGQGMGILVEPGMEIGYANPLPAPPDTGFPEHVRVDHFAPEGVDGWSRLTLKVITADNTYFTSCFLFYVIANAVNEQWTSRPTGRGPDNQFIDQCFDRTEALPVVKVTTDLDFDLEYDEGPAQMPAALPDVRLHLKRDDQVRGVPCFFDMFDRASEGLWRVSSPLPAGEYDVTFADHPVYAPDDGPIRLSIV